MDEIKVNSLLDLKTYFNIGMLLKYRRPVFIGFLILYFFLLQFFFFYDLPFSWTYELMVIGVYVLFMGGLLPLLTYLNARRYMKNIIFISEPNVYTITNEKIELKGETVSSSITWPHIKKFIEREKYFILMTPGRAFYYLPKSGFASDEDITKLKNWAREKGVKMSYH